MDYAIVRNQKYFADNTLPGKLFGWSFNKKYNVYQQTIEMILNKLNLTQEKFTKILEIKN